MADLKIDLSKIKDELEGKKSLSQVLKSRAKKTIFYLALFLIIIISLISVRAVLSKKDQQIQNVSLWTQIKHLITSKDKTLIGEEEDRINFLLLGMGGIGHEGPYLTDTVILASFKPSIKKIALISIPRDMVLPIPGYGWRRINHVNALGEAQNPGSGAEFANQVIEQILQIPIHYYLRIDFAGFTEFIDELGGIKVCVERSFIDTQYPAPYYQYQTVSFKAGCQKMNGETALKFVRSRHGSNNEGSDFARNQRQQKVILAVKDKILSFKTFLNPLTIKKMFNQFSEHVSTNLEIWEMIKLARLAQGIGSDDIISQGLSNSQEGILEVVIGEDGAFLLQPLGGNFDQIRKLVQNIFGQETLAEKKEQTKAEEKLAQEKQKEEEQKIKKIKKEQAQIEIRNGTFIVGLAARTQAHLTSLGYNVPTIGNAPFRDYEKNVIYDLSGDKFPQTFETLIQELKANVSNTIPTWLSSISEADIVVILGQEAGKLNL